MNNNTSFRNVSSYRGYYNGHFLRSYNEFLYALYVEHIENKKIKPEPFKLKSPVTGKSKVPDFIVTSANGVSILVEVKGTKKETLSTVIDYTVNNYDTRGYEVKFFTVNSRQLKILLQEKIGKDRFAQLSSEYKSQRLTKFYPGFSNKLNPMFGKKHSLDTIQKIKNNLPDVSGENNPMYGKKHSSEDRAKIGNKWKNPNTIKLLVLKGLSTAMQKLDEENRKIYLDYAEQVLTYDIPVMKPKSINNYIAITESKLNKYFDGSRNDYLNFIKEILCQR